MDYISISEMSERDGISKNALRRIAVGGFRIRNGEKVFERGRIKYGRDYIRKGDRIYINERIKVIRGEIKQLEQ